MISNAPALFSGMISEGIVAVSWSAPARQFPKTSLWKLPSWCAPRDGHYPLTYHSREECWGIRNHCVLLQTKSPGQEFVLHTKNYPEAVQWAKGLITRGVAA